MKGVGGGGGRLRGGGEVKDKKTGLQLVSNWWATMNRPRKSFIFHLMDLNMFYNNNTRLNFSVPLLGLYQSHIDLLATNNFY